MIHIQLVVWFIFVTLTHWTLDMQIMYCYILCITRILARYAPYHAVILWLKVSQNFYWLTMFNSFRWIDNSLRFVIPNLVDTCNITDCAHLSSVGYFGKVHADIYCLSIHMCGIRTKQALVRCLFNVYQMGTWYQVIKTLVCYKIILH